MCIHQSIIDDFEILLDWFNSRRAKANQEDAKAARLKKRQRQHIERLRKKRSQDLERYRKELVDFEEKKDKIDAKMRAILKTSLDQLFVSIKESNKKFLRAADSRNVVHLDGQQHNDGQKNQQPLQQDTAVNKPYSELDFEDTSEEEMYLDEQDDSEDKTDIQRRILIPDDDDDDEEHRNNNGYDDDGDAEYESAGAASCSADDEDVCGGEYDDEDDASGITPKLNSPASSVSEPTNSLIESFTTSLQFGLHRPLSTQTITCDFDQKASLVGPVKRARGRPKGSRTCPSKKLPKKIDHTKPAAGGKKRGGGPHAGRKPTKSETRRLLAGHSPSVKGGRKAVTNFRYNPLAVYEQQQQDEDDDEQRLSSPLGSADFNHALYRKAVASVLDPGCVEDDAVFDDGLSPSTKSLLLFNEVFVDADALNNTMLVDEFDIDRIAVPDSQQAAAAERSASTDTCQDSRRLTSSSSSNRQSTNNKCLPPAAKKPFHEVKSPNNNDDDDHERPNEENSELTITTTNCQPQVSSAPPTATTSSTSTTTFPAGPKSRCLAAAGLVDDNTSEEEPDEVMSETGIQNIVDSLFDTGAADLLLNNCELLQQQDNDEGNDDCAGGDGGGDNTFKVNEGAMPKNSEDDVPQQIFNASADGQSPEKQQQLEVPDIDLKAILNMMIV